MKRLLLPLLLSTLGTIILFVGAAMHGGMCHCMTAMFALFPYGSFVMMRMSWDSFGLLLAVLQVPVYAVVITVVNGVRWKMIVLVFIVILHVGAASFALRDYCQSRRRCAVAPSNKRLQRTGISVHLIDSLLVNAVVVRPLKRGVSSYGCGASPRQTSTSTATIEPPAPASITPGSYARSCSASACYCSQTVAKQTTIQLLNPS